MDVTEREIFKILSTLVLTISVNSIKVIDVDGLTDLFIRPYDEEASAKILDAYHFNQIYPQGWIVDRVTIDEEGGCYDIVINMKRGE